METVKKKRKSPTRTSVKKQKVLIQEEEPPIVGTEHQNEVARLNKVIHDLRNTLNHCRQLLQAERKQNERKA